MPGRVIYIYDDSILGFAFTYLLQQKNKRLSNKTTITKDELNSLRHQYIKYAKNVCNPGTFIFTSKTNKEFYSRKELQRGIPEVMFRFNPSQQVYEPVQELGYFQSIYNEVNAMASLSYKIYSNKEILSSLIEQQIQK